MALGKLYASRLSNLYLTASVRCQANRVSLLHSQSTSDDSPQTADITVGATVLFSLTTSGSEKPHTVSATVEKAFTPFTCSQALFAKLNPPYVLIADLPQSMILKLFDRRFVEYPSYGSNWDKPWSPEVEESLRCAVLQLEARTLQDIPNVALDSFLPDEAVGWEDWQIQKFIWNVGLNRWNLECQVYQRLKSLQEVGIPRFYGKVEVHRPDAASREPILSRVIGMAIEYIDGLPLTALEVGRNITKPDAHHMSKSLLDIVRSFRRHGVVHGDIAARNILIRRSDNAPFLIDFGQSELQTKESDEEWTEYVRSNVEIQATQDIFADDWKMYSPTPGAIGGPHFLRGYKDMNRFLERMDPTYREAHYERVTPEGRGFETRVDRDGNTNIYGGD
ncbi:hypothetical protein FRB95_004917 [Tulasnella sp. JGI-2019a]|nr:hypothetical protein FRB95_004917 [Tulasnella sp. JGI-2019a]